MDLLGQVVQQLVPMSAASLSRLLDAFERRELAEGARLVVAGERCEGIAFIERGVFISQSLVSAREASCDLFAEGDFATDYVSVLTKAPATVDVTALEAAVVRWLPVQRLEPLFGSSIELERLGRKLAEAQFLRAVQRAAELLSTTPAERYRQLTRERPGLVNRVPLFLIAQWLGVTPESLSRIRRRLVQRKVTGTSAAVAKSKAASAKAGGPKAPRASREKP